MFGTNRPQNKDAYPRIQGMSGSYAKRQGEHTTAPDISVGGTYRGRRSKSYKTSLLEPKRKADNNIHIRERGCDPGPAKKKRAARGGPSLPINKGMVDIRQKRGNAAKGTPQPEPHPQQFSMDHTETRVDLTPKSSLQNNDGA